MYDCEIPVEKVEITEINSWRPVVLQISLKLGYPLPVSDPKLRYHSISVYPTPSPRRHFLTRPLSR